MLKNQRIVVVGGASGIGFAVAELLIRRGARVLIASRSRPKLEQAAQQLGAAVEVECVDVSSEDSVRQFFTRIGTFDHLIASIKPQLPAKSFLENDPVRAKAAIDTKFWGQYLLARYGAASLHENGSIILTSGIAAHRSYQAYSAVAVMNAATEALCKGLAVELAPIRVNTVCPGFVDTAPPSPGRVEHVRHLAPGLPLGRLASASEVAEAYLYLLCNTYATGSVVVVDGGAVC